MNDVISILVITVLALIVIIILCHRRKNRIRWLEKLLDPSISLETLMFSLKQAFPYNNESIFDPAFYRNSGCINLSRIKALFSERLMWQLVDVHIRNADIHYKTFSNCYKDGNHIIEHLIEEIHGVYWIRDRAKIDGSSLSKESKERLLK